MESKVNNDKNTPKKTMHNILLEKAAQGKFPLTFGCDSPFRILPPASSPPSRAAKIKNPFEAQLTERLHGHVFSPSVFSNVSKIKTEEKFKWEIEDISTLKPADIDEASIEQFEQTDNDPEIETTAQEQIEKFFSGKHIVPSPFDLAIKRTPLISESTSPIKTTEGVIDGVTQTILTLPPKLPKHIEDVLKPYFSYTINQQQTDVDKNSSLYCKLFEFENQQVSPASVLTSPAPSFNISPIDFSPCNDIDVRSRRNFGSPLYTLQMSECNLSPIHSQSLRASRNPVETRLHFSEHMSVDTSSNLVPDVYGQLPTNDQSITFEQANSPVREVISNSLVNWEMEYRHISLASPFSQNDSVDEMDVSSSNTPKSKIFMSQRKKLSESFLKIENLDEDKENVHVERKSVKSKLFAENETASGNLTLPEPWGSSHLFASTPTKNNKQ